MRVRIASSNLSREKMTNDNKNEEPQKEEVPKFVRATFLSDGNINLEMNAVNVWDLFALAEMLRLHGETLYARAQALASMQNQPALIRARQMPLGKVD